MLVTVLHLDRIAVALGFPCKPQGPLILAVRITAYPFCRCICAPSCRPFAGRLAL